MLLQMLLCCYVPFCFVQETVTPTQMPGQAVKDRQEGESPSQDESGQSPEIQSQSQGTTVPPDEPEADAVTTPAGTGTTGSLTDPDLSGLPPIVDYNISVKLDPETQKLFGEQTLRYTNHAPDLINDLRFHLYLNAFKNNHSVYMRETGGQSPGWKGWGYLHVVSAKVNGVDLTGAMNFVTFPDGAPGDQTVLGIPLPSPLAPGETATIEFVFEAKLPVVTERTGHQHDFFFVAQWFPKIGVWETRGFRGAKEAGWNCHPFHGNTEFYANFGNYRVAIEAPAEYVVGATGVLEGNKTEDNTTIHVYQQDRVHDFAFTASPRLLRYERIFDPKLEVREGEIQAARNLLGVEREALELQPVRMILYLQPEHEAQADRHFAALAEAIKYFGLRFGPYPYPVITMVDPGHGARDAGGMEYPTFITLGTHWRKPNTDLGLESLIIHEFGHQYWYGMVASNEFEEAWLDEGITTYCTADAMEVIYGTAPSYTSLSNLTPLFPPHRLLGLNPENPSYRQIRIPLWQWLGFQEPSRWDIGRRRGLSGGGQDAILRHGWRFRSRSSYGRNVYRKAATMLYQLRQELGEEGMARALRAYFESWSFKHPHTEDFIAVVARVSGRDMSPFFEELFSKPGWLDFEVRLRSTAFSGGGYVDGEKGPDPEQATHPGATRQEVIVRNHGAARYPVTLEITFDNDKKERLLWDGRYPWHHWTYDDQAAIRQVILDPDNHIHFDAYQANNGYSKEPDSRAARRISVKLLVWVQHVLGCLAGGL